jgi:hypothetical protein
MGQSLFTGGKILIEVSKEHYSCGEMIHGTVFVE